jgi:hypothetical protein
VRQDIRIGGIPADAQHEGQDSASLPTLVHQLYIASQPPSLIDDDTNAQLLTQLERACPAAEACAWVVWDRVPEPVIGGPGRHVWRKLIYWRGNDLI